MAAGEYDYAIAFQERIRIPDDKMDYYKDLAEMYVGDDVSPDFYGWVFPKYDHVAVGESPPAFLQTGPSRGKQKQWHCLERTLDYCKSQQAISDQSSMSWDWCCMLNLKQGKGLQEDLLWQCRLRGDVPTQALAQSSTRAASSSTSRQLGIARR